jgi:hypothetical protein
VLGPGHEQQSAPWTDEDLVWVFRTFEKNGRNISVILHCFGLFEEHKEH